MDELSVGRKPCFVKSKGLEGGSFVRTHDGDRRLTSYEVHILVSGRGQPLDDMAPVKGAGRGDLDDRLVASLLQRVRARRGPVMAAHDDIDVLRMLGVMVGERNDPSVTLAGLMSLGRYPQQFLPQVNVTFVAFPTVTGRPLRDGTRFLDNEPIDGSIPAMVAGTQAAVRRNITRRALVGGEGRLDVWEYPDEAVREIVVNALMHRDYHPSSHGSQVRVELYPDRLLVTSPGGIHGGVDIDHFFVRPVSSSRNSRLAKLLEDVEIPSSGRTVCENRGSGLLAVAASLQDAGQDLPTFDDEINSCTVALVSGEYLRGTSRAAPRGAESPIVVHAPLRDRIRSLLTEAPLGTRAMADALGVSRSGVLKCLRTMEHDGDVERTESTRRSPHNRWRIAPRPQGE